MGGCSCLCGFVGFVILVIVFVLFVVCCFCFVLFVFVFVVCVLFVCLFFWLCFFFFWVGGILYILFYFIKISLGFLVCACLSVFCLFVCFIGFGGCWFGALGDFLVVLFYCFWVLFFWGFFCLFLGGGVGEIVRLKQEKQENPLQFIHSKSVNAYNLISSLIAAIAKGAHVHVNKRQRYRYLWETKGRLLPSPLPLSPFIFSMVRDQTIN